MFKLGHDGYSMTFKNGHTVSVRWHQCVHYVSERTLDCDTDAIRAMATDSVKAEVMVLDSTGEFIDTPFNELDMVIGWQSPDQVYAIMSWARGLKHE